MNGYSLTRNWYNFKFENPSTTNARHSDMYFYIVDLWNRLGQKKEFGLPTSVTMEALQIGSYNTYKKTLNDLIDFGFIDLIKKSKNQHHSKIVALSKYDKASNKPLDKAHNKAPDKPTDTIIEQRTKNNKTIEERKQVFYTQISEVIKDKREKYSNDKKEIRRFYEYWIEHGLSDKKMRHEKEKSFGIARRLDTWFNNKDKFSGKSEKIKTPFK